MNWKTIVSSFIVFSVICGLFLGFYDGLRAEYGFVPNDVDENGESVMSQLYDIQIIAGINNSVSAVHKIKPPTGAKADILGALASAGLGVLQLITGVISFPVEIVGVVTGFYYVPPIVSVGICLMFMIYISFMLLEDYRRKS